MLIDDESLEICCSQWHPGDRELVATAKVGTDLTEIMPYVNAEARRPDYHPSIPVIVWWEGEHQVALRSHEISINHMADSVEAEARILEVIDWINSLWERRAEITPDFEPRTPPPLMSVLKLLPRNNCRLCGLPTCTAFAARLIDGDRSIGDCPPLLSGTGSAAAERLRGLGLT